MYTAKRLTGEELFQSSGRNLTTSLLSFWQWMSSDLLSNATRGRLAEYLVATDIGIAGGVRREWISYDLTTPQGTKIEVKSAAYIQGWNQSRPSIISFDIRPTIGWDPDTALFGDAQRRQADVYVFCLLDEQDPVKVDPMDVVQWRFFVLATRVLDLKCPVQKSIGFKKLLALGPEETQFGGLAGAVTRAAAAGVALAA
jgi:hypothetical protein